RRGVDDRPRLGRGGIGYGHAASVTARAGRTVAHPRPVAGYVGRVSARDDVSETFDPTRWREVEGWDGTDITYHRGVDRTGEVERDLPVVRIAFDRPEIRNAFRPRTVDELHRALDHARLTTDVGSVILKGNGPSAKDGGWASCYRGHQQV